MRTILNNQFYFIEIVRQKVEEQAPTQSSRGGGEKKKDNFLENFFDQYEVAATRRPQQQQSTKQEEEAVDESKPFKKKLKNEGSEVIIQEHSSMRYQKLKVQEKEDEKQRIKMKEECKDQQPQLRPEKYKILQQGVSQNSIFTMTQGPKTKVKTEKDYLYEIIQAQREKEQGLNQSQQVQPPGGSGPGSHTPIGINGLNGLSGVNASNGQLTNDLDEQKKVKRSHLEEEFASKMQETSSISHTKTEKLPPPTPPPATKHQHHHPAPQDSSYPRKKVEEGVQTDSSPPTPPIHRYFEIANATRSADQNSFSYPVVQPCAKEVQGIVIESHHIFCLATDELHKPQLFFQIKPKVYATNQFLAEHYPTQLLRYYQKFALYQ